MTILGIDPGERRIGIAISDPLGVAARPLVTIEHMSLAEDVTRVVEMASTHKAERIVVGLPLNMDGSAGPAARKAGRFANAIRRKSRLEVVLWDERLTTVEAEETLSNRRAGSKPAPEEGRRAGPRPAHVRDMIDRTAAAVMLQDYLNAQRIAGDPCA